MSEKQAHQPQQAYDSRSSNNKPEDKATFLARNAIFRQLDVDELHEIERITTIVTYASGRILYRPGEKGTTLFLLVSGIVHLYHLSTDGRKLITATPEIDTCFGEVALLGNGTHSSFAEVIKEARICVMSKYDIEQLAMRKPSITTALLKSVGQHFAQIEAQLVNTTFKSVNARLATLLLQLAHETKIIDGLSHEELAERLGVYRETVSVALRELKEGGAIVLGRKHVTICNKPLLKEIAG
ncbi:MAG: Crp/Fnr family transcriptional regulator [Ktedonobacteraceae bacterium]